jgi:hypothetical protein
MFETSDYLRFDLEYPRQAVNIPTKYNSLEKMQEDVCEIISGLLYLVGIITDCRGCSGSKYNSREKMEKGVEEIVAKMKERRKRFGVVGAL